jgi:hypothetical protein
LCQILAAYAHVWATQEHRNMAMQKKTPYGEFTNKPDVF